MELSSSPAGAKQSRGLGIVRVIGNRPVSDPVYSFVDHEPGHQEPFARDHRISEAILDLNVELRWIENPVDEVFQLGAVDVVELVCCCLLVVSQARGRRSYRERCRWTIPCQVLSLF